MEQTVNTFQKGLQTDIHPMVQGNDVLSDALNATFVTMNGNEIILQNDMGNRRIDNAFLPPGYEPVGIKEYGGIIYIAAYNPITNQSQLGSFPSPERKLSAADFKNDNGQDTDLQGKLDFDSFAENNILKTDSILVPLTKKDSLHAGDKFVVYSFNNLSSDDISNYNNIDEDKVKSPKNKSYTLALGILNSQNEFVDITKSLVRWNNNEILLLEGKSDLYKFNAGYFIASSAPNMENLDLTKKDKALIQERLTIPANTYAYKLIGPLYLKATLNRIQEFNYNIYGNIISKNGDNITGCDIIIEGFITYNCPDGDTTKSNNSGGEYSDYYETSINKLGWAYTFTPGNTYSTSDNATILLKQNDEKSVYNPETNTYSAKIVKKYNITSGIVDNKLKYALGVIANSEKEYIVENLSVKGEIDLNKLGSGEVTLNSWRFYNTNESTTLVYGFEAYPKYGQSFKDLTFTFIKVGDQSSKIFNIEEKDGLKLFNGRNTININWKDFDIEPRKLYKVEVKYSIDDEYGNGSQNINLATRWFLSTPLMNDCFNSQSYSFIKDYGNPDSEKECEVLDQKLQVLSRIEFDIKDTSKFVNNITDTGNWITNTNQNIEISKTYTYNLSLNLNPSIYIYNEEYYPDYIKIQEVNGNSRYDNLIKTFLGNDDNQNIIQSNNSNNTLNYNNSEEIKKLTNKIKPLNKQAHDNDFVVNDDNFISDILTIKGKQISKDYISIDIEFKNKLQSKASQNGMVQNVFGDKDYYKKSISLDGKSQALPYYGGFSSTYYDPGSNHRYRHVINFFTTQSSYNGNTLTAQDLVYTKADNNGNYIGQVGNQSFNEVRVQICFDESDADRNWPDKEEHTLGLLRAINNINYKSAILYYGETIYQGADPGITIRADLSADNNNGYRGTEYARIFIRKVNGSWALFDQICNITSNTLQNRFNIVFEFLKKYLFDNKDIIYCFAHDKDFSELGLYHVDNENYVYNDKIKLNIPFNIQYSLTSVTYNSVINSTGIQCKNKDIDTYLIKFTDGNNGNEKITEVINYPKEIECPDELQDQIHDMFINDYNKLCIVPPYNLDRDSNGYELSIQKVYELTDNKLVDSKLKNLTVSPEFGASGYNTIVYNGDELGIFQYPYDCEKGSIRTTLSYSNLVDKVIT